MINRPEPSLVELFQEEARAQTALLTEQVLALEGEGNTPERLAALMRAAHSLKGAARIVNRDVVLRVAHAMEDWFVAVQQGRASVTRERVDVMLWAVDLLSEGAALAEDATAEWTATSADRVQAVLGALVDASAGMAPPDRRGLEGARRLSRASNGFPAIESPPGPPASSSPATASTREQRTTSGSLDRVVGLTGQAVVACRQLEAHATDSVAHRRAQYALGGAIDELRDALAGMPLDGRARRALTALGGYASERQEARRKRDADLDVIARRLSGVIERLYREALDSRMRSFEEGTVPFPRMLRDIARELGKDARLVVNGGSTPVDREVLRRLDAPLVHLLRNAADHGIEPAAERRAAGKPECATITVTARHGGGRLLVTVEDDGRGIDVAGLRAAIVRKRLADEAATAVMSERELLEFLFLPGFSLRDEVTVLSGRGVGLDAVHTAVHEFGGTIRVASVAGKGTRFELQLPLTLSVVRVLIAEVNQQPYAMPLARVRCVLRLTRDQIESVEGRQHLSLAGRQVGLLWAHQILGVEPPTTELEATPVIVLDDHEHSYGIAVDRLLGEQEVVLRGLDSQLGKVQNVGAAALLPDGAPVLVLDIDDVVRSIANLLAGGRLDPLRRSASGLKVARKRVLIADDSLTVRELERQLIEARGYDVDVAVDGMDAWNAIRSAHYDLLVTDVDMPRLGGVELIELVRKDASLRSLPIMIVSYKDRDEDRHRGLEAGADHYLTKASFYDETMLRAIEDLIGAST